MINYSLIKQYKFYDNIIKILKLRGSGYMIDISEIYKEIYDRDFNGDNAMRSKGHGYFILSKKGFKDFDNKNVNVKDSNNLLSNLETSLDYLENKGEIQGYKPRKYSITQQGLIRSEKTYVSEYWENWFKGKNIIISFILGIIAVVGLLNIEKILSYMLKLFLEIDLLISQLAIQI